MVPSPIQTEPLKDDPVVSGRWGGADGIAPDAQECLLELIAGETWASQRDG
jgi:hypothetical protein